MSENIYIPGVTDQQEQLKAETQKAAAEYVGEALSSINQLALVANYLESRTIDLIKEMIKHLDELEAEWEPRKLAGTFSKKSLVSERARLYRKIADHEQATKDKAAENEATKAELAATTTMET
jgi:hypothetical protein